MQTWFKKKVDSGLTPTCLAGRADATSLRSEERARAGGGAGAGAGRALAGQDEGESWARAATLCSSVLRGVKCQACAMLFLGAFALRMSNLSNF